MMRKVTWVGLICASLFLLSWSVANAAPPEYIGSLDSNVTLNGHPEIYFGDTWGTTTGGSTDPIYFHWDITDKGGSNVLGDLWEYDYTLTVGNGKDISHVLLGVSSDFKLTDLINASGNWTAPADYTPTSNGNSDPGLPGDIWALKLDSGDPYTGTSWNMIFYSYRAPVWGDFYAKDGKSGGDWCYAYNWDFGANPNPSIGPSSGLETDSNGHQYAQILRPDTGGSHWQDTPELPPGALALLSMLPVGLLWRRRRS